MKKLTYRLEFEEEILISEEICDSQGNVISLKEYGKGFSRMILKEFNSENFPIRIESYENDELLNVIEYDYNENGEALEQRLLIGEEIYERIITSISSEGFIRITVQDGEEVEKLIHRGDSKNYKNEFYQHGELIEYQIRKEDTTTGEVSIEFYDSFHELVGKDISSYDRINRLIHHRELNANGQLLKESKFEYNSSLLVKRKTQDFTNDFQSIMMIYEYNQKNELINQEKRDLAGNVLEFQKFAYDNRGRCIEEVIVSVGGSDPFYGSGQMSNKVHLIHEYE